MYIGNKMEYSKALKKLDSIIRNWKDIDEKNTQFEHRQLKEFTSKLKVHNWKRLDIYNLIHDVLKDEDFPEVIVDIILDFESTITGYCDPACILEFSDEKINSKEELIKYVRGNMWKK